MKVINERVAEVLRVKFRLGLFDSPYVLDPKAADKIVGADKNEDFVLDIQKQLEFNARHGIKPQSIQKTVGDILDGVMSQKSKDKLKKLQTAPLDLENLSSKALGQKIKALEAKMHNHAMRMEFEEAAQVRDELFALKEAFKTSL